MQNISKKFIGSVVLVITLITCAFFWYGYLKNNVEDMKITTVNSGATAENSAHVDFGDVTEWEEYKNEQYGILIKHPKEWNVQALVNADNATQYASITLSWNDNMVSIFPTGKPGFICHAQREKGTFERIHIDKYTEELFTKTSNGGKMHSCTTDLNNYPMSWDDEGQITMDYDASVKEVVWNIVQNISFPEGVIDVVSLNLYGSRAGMQDSVRVDTKKWLTEKDDKIDFAFLYPKGSKIINEGNCYRVEYGLGFVIFLLPVDGDMRCGARTGVGVLPSNVDVKEYVTIQGKEYNASGFHAVMDTKEDMFFKPSTRYSYDFNHLIHMQDVPEYCNGNCLIIGYGIYKETAKPFARKDVDMTMDTLRAIVESLQYKK